MRANGGRARTMAAAKGTTKIAVRARKAGRLKVKVRGQKASCPALTVRAR